MALPLKLQISALRSALTRDRMVKLVCSQIGTKEWPGADHNPEVLKYFAASGHAWVEDDETAWCAAFMNWVAAQMGLPTSSTLLARDWQNQGTEVPEVDHAIPFQDIVVFWRVQPDSWQGHVGIYVNHIGKDIEVLGGNQANEVSIQTYSADRLLAIRRLF